MNGHHRNSTEEFPFFFVEQQRQKKEQQKEKTRIKLYFLFFLFLFCWFLSSFIPVAVGLNKFVAKK